MNKWTIDKSFSFCYGHRVHNQELVSEFCEIGDNNCKCRFLHGHEGLLHVFLEAETLEGGMVCDFKHLGWLKNFLDDNLDHKFIIDRNDPWFNNIVSGEIREHRYVDGTCEVLEIPANEAYSDGRLLRLIPLYVPETEHLAGHSLHVEHLSGPEQEFYEGFFIVDFVPTSENLCKWVYDCIEAKMSRLGVKVSHVTWNETPKSRASYSGE